MAKPTKLPRWADAAPAGAIVEPNEGKKDVGWKNGERPPNQFVNWWKNLAYQWTSWLDDEVSGLITALGGDPSTDSDALNEKMEQGTFSPEVVGALGTAIDSGDFTKRNGIYQRLGKTVIVWFDISFDNTNGAINGEVMYITPPFTVDESLSADVSVYCKPNRNASPRFHRILETALFDAGPPIDRRFTIDEINGDTGAESQNIVIGSAVQDIRVQLAYFHTGEYRY